MLVVADTLLNYDLNETFLVQDGVLRAPNQLQKYWCARSMLLFSVWINNIKSIICLHEVITHFYSPYACSSQWPVIHDAASAVSFLVNQPWCCKEWGGCVFCRTRTVFKWKPQAVQTRWQCKWQQLMTDSPLAWVLIKNSSFSSLPLKW